MIAQRFGVTVEAIAEANRLPDPNTIYPGQTLFIPEGAPTAPPGTIRYTVRPGETLWRIARRFGTTVEAIVQLNNITDPSRIFPGQTLLIPVGPAVPPAPPPPPPPPPPPGQFVYTVRPGDTLWLIARRFGTTVEAIVQANNLVNPEQIFPGQRLIIPVVPPAPPPPPPPPPPVPPPPTAPRPLTNFVYYPGMEQSGPAWEQLSANARMITYVGFVNFRIGAGGEVIGTPNRAMIDQVHAWGVGAIAVVSNWNPTTFRFDRELVHAVLSDTTLRTRLVTAIRNLVVGNNFEGINIDLEDIPPGDRALFTQFVTEVRSALSSEGRLTTTAVMAKTADLPEQEWVGVYDYAALGAVNDLVVVMTYDEHWAGGPPGPIASVPWMQSVITYAVSQIPASKILIGVPVYGFDWRVIPPQTGLAPQVTFRQAMDLAARYGATVVFDATAREPHFTYTTAPPEAETHEVWFQNAASVSAKLDLMVANNLLGIAIWSMEFTFPEMWDVIRQRFTVTRIR